MLNLVQDLKNNYLQYSKYFTNALLVIKNQFEHLSYIPKILKFVNMNEIHNYLRHNDLRYNDILVEYKLDGLLINICYINNKIVYVHTKGNRHCGLDLTDIFINSKMIPKFLKNKIFGNSILEIRAEMIISKKIFNKFYRNKFINARSALTSIINTKTINLDDLKNIDIIAYDISMISKSEYSFNSQICIYSFLKEIGFIVPIFKIYDNDFSIEDINRDFNLKEYEYECDGIIFKINNVDQQFKYFTSLISKYIFSLKSTIRLTTSVLDIIFSMTKDHAIIPSIIIEQLNYDDKKCSKLSLYSIANLSTLNIGSKIEVLYNTTFIFNKVININADINLYDINVCPFCNEKILKLGKKYYCVNVLCCEKIFAKIYGYIRIKKISTFGEKMIRLLIKNKILTHGFDILNPNFLSSIDLFFKINKHIGIKEKKVENLINGIKYLQDNYKIFDLIILLGIPSIGLETINKLSDDILNKVDIFNTDYIEKNTFLNMLQKKNMKMIRDYNVILGKFNYLKNHVLNR